MIVGVIASPADLRLALALREPPDLFELRHLPLVVTVLKVPREDQVVSAFLYRSLRNIHKSRFIASTSLSETLSYVGGDGYCCATDLIRHTVEFTRGKTRGQLIRALR